MLLLFLMLVIDFRGRTFDDFSIDDVLIYLSFFSNSKGRREFEKRRNYIETLGVILIHGYF